MRRRDDTIGALGRAPARPSKVALPPPEPPPPERGAIRRWLHGAAFENTGLKFLSLVLAVTVFLLVNTDKDREITAHIGVSYTLPEDKVLVSERLDDVRVTIKGSWRRLRKFNEHEVDRINFDLRRAPSGEFPITADLVHLPAGLSIAEISPRTVRVAFDKRSEKLVEIAPAIAGRPQHGYVVAEVKAAPATVKVRGAEKLLAALSAIRTRELSLDGRTESFVAESELVPPDGVELVGGAPAQVHVTIDEELVTRKLPGLTVQVRPESGAGGEAKWSVSPAQVEVTLTGALLAVEKARAELVPVVHLAAGAREVAVTLDNLPPGVGVRISPERVKVAPIR